MDTIFERNLEEKREWSAPAAEGYRFLSPESDERLPGDEWWNPEAEVWIRVAGATKKLADGLVYRRKVKPKEREMHLLVDFRSVWAMAAFAQRLEKQPVLGSVELTTTSEGVLLAASNRVVLGTYLERKEGPRPPYVAGDSVLLPLSLIEDMAAAFTRRGWLNAKGSYGEIFLEIRVAGKRIRVIDLVGETVWEVEELPWRFPNWRCVLPKAGVSFALQAMMAERTVLDPEQLSFFHKAAERLPGDKAFLTLAAYNGSAFGTAYPPRAVWIQERPEFFGVIMPGADNRPTRVPGWLQSEGVESRGSAS